MKITGACIYCGQIHMVNTEDTTNEAEINRIATLYCNCPDAVREQEIEKSVSEAKDYIKEIFASEDLQRLLTWEVELVARHTIEKANISKGEIKVMISRNAKGFIKIDKTRTIKEEKTI